MFSTCSGVGVGGAYRLAWQQPIGLQPPQLKVPVGTPSLHAARYIHGCWTNLWLLTHSLTVAATRGYLCSPLYSKFQTHQNHCLAENREGALLKSVHFLNLCIIGCVVLWHVLVVSCLLCMAVWFCAFFVVMCDCVWLFLFQKPSYFYCKALGAHWSCISRCWWAKCVCSNSYNCNACLINSLLPIQAAPVPYEIYLRAITNQLGMLLFHLLVV